MAELTKEQALQETLISWVLAGGTCHGLFVQMELFVDALTEIDDFQDGGDRQQALERLLESLDEVQRLALKVDGTGVPNIPPHLKPAAPAPAEATPIEVLVETRDGLVGHVRASVPVHVSLWDHREVREGMVPVALLNMPLQQVRILSERDLEYPETKQAGDVTLYLLRVDGEIRRDRAGRPIYCSVPSDEQS